MKQVQVTELQNPDLRGLLADEVRVVVHDTILILGEEGDQMPHLIADLDRAVIAHHHRNTLVLGVGEREAGSILADDAGDLLAGRHRLALGVDVGEVGGRVEREIGFRRDDGLAVLARAHHVELAFAVRTKVGDVVVARRFIHLDSPLLIHDLHFLSPLPGPIA